MRYLSIFVLVTLAACASMDKGNRAPNSNGAAGGAGSGGASGSDGRAGTMVVARGCESYLVQTIGAIRSSQEAARWESSVEFMCDSTTSLQPEAVRQAHRILDEKVSNFLASGGPASFEPGTEKRFEQDFEGLKRKLAFYGDLLKKLEMKAKRDYGCRRGTVVWGPSQGREEMKICQRTDLDYINPDGTFTIRFDLEAFRDDMPNYPATRETALLESLPELCENGGIRFQAVSNGSSQGKKFVKKTLSDCDTFDAQYSSIYPKVSIRF